MPEHPLTPEEEVLVKKFRELLRDPDLLLPFIENVSAGFGIDDGIEVELTLSKRRN